MIGDPANPMTAGAWGVFIGYGLMLFGLVALLFVLRLGPTRWPLFARQMWDDAVPVPAQKVTLRVASSVWPWFLLGLLIGESFLGAFVPPLARHLRDMMPN